MLIILTGIAITGFGIMLWFRRKMRTGKCTAVTEGTVTEIRAVSSPPSEGEAAGSVTYHPVYRYFVGKDEYERFQKEGDDVTSVTVGQTVRVFYDPDNPACCIVPEGDTQTKAPQFFIIFGILYTLMGIALSLTGTIS